MYAKTKKKFGKDPKPILFDTEMVQAILEDRKTQTRRPIKEQPKGYLKSPYQVGDILYVRETWKVLKISFELLSLWVQYQADEKCKRIKFEYDRFHKFRKYYDKPGWQPSIFMPKEAARIFLKVTDVRVERIQDIDYSGAIAEGIEETEIFNELLDECSSIGAGTGTLPVQAFADLWEGLYGSKGYDWKDNPWVWVYELERVDAHG